MAVTPAVAALSLVATLVLLAGFWTWLITAARAAITWRWVGDSAAARMAGFLQSLGISPRLPLVAWSPRRPVPWTTIDLLVLIGLYVLGSTVAVSAAEDIGVYLVAIGSFVITISRDEVLILASLVASLAILVIGLPLVGFRTGATLDDFGWSLRDLGRDFGLGIVAFVMLAPPVYAVQGLLVSFWQESKHPLVEMFKEEPNVGFFAILFVSAAVVAPLFEEMVFRVLLQGLLEKVFAPAKAAAQPADESQLEAQAPSDNTQDGDRTPVSPPENNPYASPQVLGGYDLADAKLASAAELDRGVSWLPVIITSANSTSVATKDNAATAGVTATSRFPP